jgi:hypothetical protein
MGSVAQKTQSPPSVEIDGVPHRQCGEGRKQHRAGAIECGRILPLSAFPVNNGYTDGHAIVCSDCNDKQNARYAERVKNALVPIRVYNDVPIGSDGHCRGVAIEVDGVQVPHLVVIEACRYWGLDSTAQLRRIQEDDGLSAGLRAVKMTAPSGAVQASYALRYDLVPQWLNSIETGKMRNEERRAQLAAYQKVCAQVLADYFFGTQTAPIAPAERVPFDEPLAGYGDTSVMRYLDSALAGFADTLEARARSILVPYLDKIKEYKTETFIDVRGVVYVCKYPRFGWPDAEHFYAMGWDRYAIGWTTKLSVEDRLKEYPGKYDVECPEEVCVIKTDNSKLEGLIHERRPKQGVSKVASRRDVFWLSPDVVTLLKQLPSHIEYETARHKLIGWVLVRKGSEVSLWPTINTRNSP